MDEVLEQKIETVKEKSDYKIAARGITKMVVRYSVSATLVTLTKYYCPVDGKKEKLQLYIGAWAIGGSMGAYAGNWASNRVVETLEIAEQLVDKFKTVNEVVQETQAKPYPSE